MSGKSGCLSAQIERLRLVPVFLTVEFHHVARDRRKVINPIARATKIMPVQMCQIRPLPEHASAYRNLLQLLIGKHMSIRLVHRAVPTVHTQTEVPT